MFKVFIVVCTILPFPRGEILQTKCFKVKDEREPSIHGYVTKKQCYSRMLVITESLKENFDLLELKRYQCQKNNKLSNL